MRRERGTSLIFVLGILALLSLFAISFATVTRVERTASANYVDEVRAKLAARAGLAAGIAAVHEGFRTPSPGVPILGGYLDTVRTITAISGTQITLGSVMGIGPGDTLTLYGDKESQEVKVATGYVPGTNPVSLTSAPSGNKKFAIPRGGSWCYAGHSLNPRTTGNGIPIAISLTMQGGTSPANGLPSLRVAAGPTLALANEVKLASGSTGGTYFADPPPTGAPYVCGGDIYATKALDSAGMLDANMEQSELQAILPQFGKDVVEEVTAIATELASVPHVNQLIPLKDASGAVTYGSPFDAAANVTAFFGFRDRLSGKKFRSKEQLKGAFHAMAGGDAERGDAWFAVFRDYFTCFGDLDGNAIQGDTPQGDWNPPGGIPTVAGVPDKTQMYQNKKKVETPGSARIQVNLNTAPLPVLVAVLSTVRARALPTTVEDSAAQPLAPISINPGLVPMAPYANAGNGVVTALSRADALAIAGALVSMRPYRSWNEVYKALNTLHGGAVPDASLAAALVATCPVDLPLSMNPDRSLLYWDAIDPTNAAAGFKVSAEKAGSHACADFSFTSGYFEIEALGRIYANPTAPYVVAEATKRCVVNVGGVVWVRGERDLARGLPGGSDIVGFPALAPSDSYVGGWVQPKPADTGIQVAGPLQSAGASLNPFNLNTSDGYLVQRTQWLGTNANVIVARANSSPNPDDMGSAEMWVKMPFDATKGTNEALFMNIRNYNQGLRHAQPGFTDDPDANSTITQIGVATRLERFGNRLYLCRFFWGYPDGASPAKVGEEQDVGGLAPASNPTTKYVDNMHGYITSPPLDWKAGTWHHVYISWNVMQMKLYVDGQDMGTPSLPPEYRGGVVWENTVQGFFPDSGSGGLNNNNEFKDVPRTTSGEQQVQNAINQAQAHKQVDQAIAANPSSSQAAVTQAQQHIIAHDQTIADGNDWFQGGNGNGNFAEDVKGMTFTAQLGLRRMKLRTHLPIPAVSDAQANAGITESYFLGYKTPDPYLNEAPPEIVTLNFKFGDPAATASFYQRYCNGTYDALKWRQTASLSAPTPVPHRYLVEDSGGPAANGSLDVTLTFPSGWVAVAQGWHVILAHDIFPAPDVDLFGGGRKDGITVTGQSVRITKSFPAGKSNCNVAIHGPSCVPGSNETTWAVAGAWIAYEKPTTFLEAPEVD